MHPLLSSDKHQGQASADVVQLPPQENVPRLGLPLSIVMGFYFSTAKGASEKAFFKISPMGPETESWLLNVLNKYLINI